MMATAGINLFLSISYNQFFWVTFYTQPRLALFGVALGIIPKQSSVFQSAATQKMSYHMPFELEVAAFLEE